MAKFNDQYANLDMVELVVCIEFENKVYEFASII